MCTCVCKVGECARVYVRLGSVYMWGVCTCVCKVGECARVYVRLGSVYMFELEV